MLIHSGFISSSFVSFEKQGWIHSNPVADGWAGAVVQKPLQIQKGYVTDMAMCRVACPRLKIIP